MVICELDRGIFIYEVFLRWNGLTRVEEKVRLVQKRFTFISWFHSHHSVFIMDIEICEFRKE